jgi:hypothetical protein
MTDATFRNSANGAGDKRNDYRIIPCVKTAKQRHLACCAPTATDSFRLFCVKRRFAAILQ